jgi:hypothetical protein
MHPRPTIAAFDNHLHAQGLHLEAVVVGGAALALLDVITRETRDFDILHPELSESVLAAARLFATEQRNLGIPLRDDWLNNGPRQLTDVLPIGWQARVQAVYAGSAISLSTLGRSDLLAAKLFALCDRGTDLPDCLALAPSAAELAAAIPWVAHQDAHPGWPAHVTATLANLARRLGHGV